MNILESRLFALPNEPRSWTSIVGWWELRRVVFNVLMFVVGSIGLVIFMIINDAYTRTQPHSDDDFVPLIAVMGCAVGANICYTGGWVSELLARRLWGERARYYGPMMFSLGLVFSLGLCFLPSITLGLSWALSILFSGHKVT